MSYLVAAIGAVVLGYGVVRLRHDDVDGWGIVLVALGFLALVGGVCLFFLQREADDCAARGGAIVGTGRYTTTYVMSGQVLVPITSEVTECRVTS